MGKIKNYYLEIIFGALCSITAIFFVYNFYCNSSNSEFLSQAKSKLLLHEARASRANEQKLNEAENNSCKQCFENALNDSGFKVFAIEKKDNYVVAIVEKNDVAKSKLTQFLDHVEYLSAQENKLEVRWFFNKKGQQMASEELGAELSDGAVAAQKESQISQTNLTDNKSVARYNNSRNVQNRKAISFKLNAICFFNHNDWQVWINGKMYDHNNTNIGPNCIIEKVSPNCVTIKSGADSISLQLD